MTALNHVPEGVPRVLANFTFTASRSEGYIVDYVLSCKSCGKDFFQVFSFPRIVRDTDGFFGRTPGETIFRPPHKLTCTACGSGAPIFDPRTDGYDAVACGFCGYETGSDGEKPATGNYRVTVSLAYNSELSELEESANDVGVSAADLFDWITITASPASGGDPLVLDYECA
ncbi:MAG TPA: hypothetical protein VFI23_00625 [Rhizomicrobium sp.]|nr:hypothetical protein [Rhizomicrobium sp.]